MKSAQVCQVVFGSLKESERFSSQRKYVTRRSVFGVEIKGYMTQKIGWGGGGWGGGGLLINRSQNMY